MAFDLDISKMELAQQLKELVTIRRVDTGGDKVVESGAYTDIATDVGILILPYETPNRIENTGEVISENEFLGIMLTPNSNIQEGDIIVRQNNPNLYINHAPKYPNVNVQYFELDEKRR